MMHAHAADLDENGKFVMNDIYNRPDPRPYFSFLQRLNYEIPQNAKTTFETILRQIRARRDRKKVKVVDLGCSYGINAALLKFGLNLPDLYGRYASGWTRRMSSDALKAQDRIMYADLDPSGSLKVVGLDVAQEAVAYAEEVGLIDKGITADLESSDDPGAEVLGPLAGADLIISTGCVGYVGETTFDHLMEANAESEPWLANFVLRMYPFDPIAERLKTYGYATEKLEGRLFRQRRFAAAGEQEEVLSNLQNLGIDTEEYEAQGWYYAELFVSRPEQEAKALPLEAMMATASAA